MKQHTTHIYSVIITMNKLKCSKMRATDCIRNKSIIKTDALFDDKRVISSVAGATGIAENDFAILN